MTTLPALPTTVDEELVAASMPEGDGAMWISPEVAALWLTRNANNRRVRAERVLMMARDMVGEHWRYTGEAIKFDIKGNLIDGQHRLMAVVKSNTTVKMLVVTGLDEDSQAFMDAGARRSAADALKFRGEANASFLASSVRLGIIVDRGITTRNDGVSHAEVIEWLTVHPEIRRSVAKASRFNAKMDIKPSTMGYALYRMAKINEDDADEFFQDLIEMRTDGPGDPIYTLIQRMLVARKSRETLSNIIELNFVTRAWNARRLGVDLKILKYPTAGFEVVKFK